MKKPVSTLHETAPARDRGHSHEQDPYANNPLLRGVTLKGEHSAQRANLALIAIEGAHDAHSLNDALQYIIDYLGVYWSEPQYRQLMGNALGLLEQRFKKLASEQPPNEVVWRAWGRMFSQVCVAYDFGYKSEKIGQASDTYRPSRQVDAGMIEAIKLIDSTTSAFDTLWRVIEELRESINNYQMSDYLDQCAKLYMKRMKQLLDERGADGYGALSLPDFRPFFTLAARAFTQGELSFLSQKNR